MKTPKTNIVIGAAILVAVVMAGIYAIQPRLKSQSYCFTKIPEVMRSIFEFHPTNTWRNVHATGIEASPFWAAIGRNTIDEYYLMQEGDTTALQEIRDIFDKRKEPKIGEGDLTYLPDYDKPIKKLQGRGIDLAPWWNTESPKAHSYVRLSVIVPQKRWSLQMYAYSKSTNATLLVHIVRNDRDF